MRTLEYQTDTPISKISWAMPLRLKLRDFFKTFCLNSQLLISCCSHAPLIHPTICIWLRNQAPKVTLKQCFFCFFLFGLRHIFPKAQLPLLFRQIAFGFIEKQRAASELLLNVNVMTICLPVLYSFFWGGGPYKSYIVNLLSLPLSPSPFRWLRDKTPNTLSHPFKLFADSQVAVSTIWWDGWACLFVHSSCILYFIRHVKVRRSLLALKELWCTVMLIN